ncbi:MAG: hypothetical protein GX575_14945 [Candidatus Anammoximicrobium sp.]|nr:hypothetical protein [Candidatus Anammoximicrobium sp.]
MCRLSIIIPLWSDNDSFEDTLASVLQNRPAECEVIVVHSQPYDDPYDLKGEVRFLPVPQNAGKSHVINAGCRASEGEIVHVLQPGVLATDGWTAAALERFDDSQICAVAPLLLDADDDDRILAAGLHYTWGGARVSHGAGRRRSDGPRVLRQAIVGPGLFAGFYRRWIWEAVGGFCERLDVSWADVDFALSLRSLGYQAVLEPASIVRGSPAAVPEAPFSFRSGLGAERVFWRHVAAHGCWAGLAFHPFTILRALLQHATCGRAYTQFLGRLSALPGLGDHLTHAGKIRRAVEFFLLEKPPATLNDSRRQESRGASPEFAPRAYRDAA